MGKENKIKEIKLKAKSAMLSRKPRENDDDEFKTLIIALFDKNNPHKTGETPIKVLEYSNMEKIRLRDLNVSFYLEGNDIVINDLKEIRLEIDEKNNKVVFRAAQEKIESR
ncbi:MAG TPA: hypothetical protein VJI75_04775 [Candidatus Nanoarchaeia archaeon]|nr:hypothetical protein [Candidatus Nanoarchaeia archaeon]